MDDSKYVVPIKKFIFDLSLLIFFGVAPFYHVIFGDPPTRGFYCTDESIRYPYIPSPRLKGPFVFTGETTAVALIVLFTEIFLNFDNKRKFSILGLKLPLCIWTSYNAVIAFLFGAAICRFATVFFKFTVGELRPHFFDVCRPDVNCTDPKNLYVYHLNYTCTNPKYINNLTIIRGLRQSFPCGQVASSAYCMLYLSIYLQFKMTWKGSKFLKHAIQFAAINLSMYIGFSNYVVYDHHPGDIVAGIVQGVVFAIVTASCLGRFQFLKEFNSEYQRIQ